MCLTPSTKVGGRDRKLKGTSKLSAMVIMAFNGGQCAPKSNVVLATEEDKKVKFSIEEAS